jgi:hypothetical protein
MMYCCIFLDQQGPHPQLHFIEKKPSSYKKAKTTAKRKTVLLGRMTAIPASSEKRKTVLL